jgi:hypothetical protein
MRRCRLSAPRTANFPRRRERCLPSLEQSTTPPPDSSPAAFIRHRWVLTVRAPRNRLASALPPAAAGATIPRASLARCPCTLPLPNPVVAPSAPPTSPISNKYGLCSSIHSCPCSLPNLRLCPCYHDPPLLHGLIPPMFFLYIISFGRQYRLIQMRIAFGK